MAFYCWWRIIGLFFFANILYQLNSCLKRLTIGYWIHDDIGITCNTAFDLNCQTCRYNSKDEEEIFIEHTRSTSILMICKRDSIPSNIIETVLSGSSSTKNNQIMIYTEKPFFLNKLANPTRTNHLEYRKQASCIWFNKILEIMSSTWEYTIQIERERLF